MISITENRPYRYILYISVYLVEGIATLMIFTILPIYLKNYKGLNDFSIAIIASISFFPIVLKPLTAIVSDKYPIEFLGGRRKPYMIIGFILNGITISLIGISDPVTAIYIFTILWVLQSLGLSLMDVALDALVVESFPDTNEKVNANIIFQVSIISSIILIIPIAHVCEIDSIHLGIHLSTLIDFDIYFGGNFEFGFFLSGIICISLILFSLILDEGEIDYNNPLLQKNELKNYLSSKNIPIILFLFFLLHIDNGLLEFTLDPFFRNLGLSAGVQLLSVSPMIIISILGGISTKWVIKKGLIKSLTVITIIFVSYLGILTFLTFTTSPYIPLFYYVAGIPVSFFSSCTFILYLTLAMKTADKNLAATSFALLVTMINVGKVFGIILAGILPFYGYLKMGIIFLISTVFMATRIPIYLNLREIDEKE